MMVALLAAAALVGSYFGVSAVRLWALRRGVLDVPNWRSSHTVPTPRGGGIVFFPVVAATLITYATLRAPEAVGDAWGFVLLGALVAVVSWLDDVRSLPPAIRFAVHITAALGAICLFGAWSHIALPFLGVVPLGPAGWVLTLLWIVGLTNAYNFMDGIDGIAAGQGIVAGLGWAALGVLVGAPAVPALGLVLAAVCLGFLGHNRPPARIFMGDVGSAYLGFSFAVLPLMAGADDPGLPLAAALVVWPFVLDTSFTFVRRLLAGENVFAAHRSHLYQRMVAAGAGHGTVSAIYAGLALGGVLLASLWYVGSGLPKSLVAVFLPAFLVVPFWLTAHWERSATRQQAERPLDVDRVP